MSSSVKWKLIHVCDSAHLVASPMLCSFPELAHRLYPVFLDRLIPH
jgi:hypothetical protein